MITLVIPPLLSKKNNRKVLSLLLPVTSKATNSETNKDRIQDNRGHELPKKLYQVPLELIESMLGGLVVNNIHGPNHVCSRQDHNIHENRVLKRYQLPMEFVDNMINDFMNLR